MPPCLFYCICSPSHPLLDRGAPDLSRVSSVEDWLAALKMTQYRDSFLGSGFTSLPLVTQITAEWVYTALSFCLSVCLSICPPLPTSHTAHLPSLCLVSWTTGRKGWLAECWSMCSLWTISLAYLLPSFLSCHKMLCASLQDIHTSLSNKLW